MAGRQKERANRRASFMGAGLVGPEGTAPMCRGFGFEGRK